MTMRGGSAGRHPGTALERPTATAALRYVTPQFFAAMGIPFHAGRDVRDSDDNTTEMVAVVSESLAKKYWPDGSALGRRFQFAFKERTIVGIVGDVRFRGLERESEPQVYLPARQVDDGSIVGYRPGDLVVKASGGDLMPSIRAIIRRADGQLAISNVRTMSEIVELDTASRSVQARVLGGFAVIAFVLAAVGIHGVLAFAVSQRTNEIGVRVALGATQADILGMVLKQARCWRSAVSPASRSPT